LTLTPEQKRAGRLFRDAAQAALDALNEASPPGAAVLVTWRVVRHECPAAGGASTGISLREHYETSPDGAFGWLWKDGRCVPCGLTVRTARGRLLVVTDHSARERQASARPGDPRQPRP
jgi:hypothetical protein